MWYESWQILDDNVSNGPREEELLFVPKTKKDKKNSFSYQQEHAKTLDGALVYLR